MTSVGSALEVARAVTSQLAAFEGLLLIASGLHKLLRRDRLRSVVRDFAGVPAPVAPVMAAMAAGIELLAGVLLCSAGFRAAGAALALVIFGTYLLLIVRALAQGRRDVDCGCSFGDAHGGLGTAQLVRNAVLMIVSLAVAAVSASGGAAPFGAARVLAALALLALYAALDQVLALKPLRAGELL